MTTIEQKLIFSGPFVEHFVFDKPITLGRSFSNRLNTKKGSKKIVRLDNYLRAKNKIKRLSWANTNDFRTFITLTFSKNITDLSVANKLFTSFQKRLKYLAPNLKYLAVVEFQKRGAVHYHFLCSYFIDADILSDLWRYGFVKIKKIKNKRNLGLYIVKYLTKDLYLERKYFMKKKFFYSSNLKKPVVVLNIDFIKKFFNKVFSFFDFSLLYQNVITLDFIGKIHYNLFSVQYLYNQ